MLIYAPRHTTKVCSENKKMTFEKIFSEKMSHFYENILFSFLSVWQKDINYFLLFDLFSKKQQQSIKKTTIISQKKQKSIKKTKTIIIKPFFSINKTTPTTF